MLRSARHTARGLWMCVIAGAVFGGIPATAEAKSLPDGRGYELVSPAAKGGGDVMPSAGRTRAAVSGDAVNFASLTPFSDAAGSGVATEYLSARTAQAGTSGWSTHAILPQLAPLSLGGAFRGKDALYQGEFSDDLSKGVLHSFTPLTNDSDVAAVSNLYVRTNVLDPGSGSYTLLSACPACAGTPLTDQFGFYQLAVASATPDLGHIIFEATRQLTPDAPPDNFFCLFVGLGCTPNLYEWDHGTLRFAGVLPNGNPAPMSTAGAGALRRVYTVNTISSDGSKVFFTVPTDPSGSEGDLYVRVDHNTTAQINASERTDCADHDPCAGAPEPDPAGPLPANFMTASADGSKVFFTSSEELTDDPGGNLYVYDTTLPPGDPHNLSRVFVDDQPVDPGALTAGVLGASSDGHYMYFMVGSALLAGQPALPAAAPVGIYLWHDGTIAFVGSINSESAGDNVINSQWVVNVGSRVTADGRSVLFSSKSGAGLTGYDHSDACPGAVTTQGAPCNELYLYRADTASLSCVSCNPTDAPATAAATFGVRTASGGAASSSHLNHPVTEDGSHVFFETGERLESQDVNGKHTDVYEWTALGAAGCEASSASFAAHANGCLDLITTGTSADDSHFLDASPSGDDLFVTTNQRMVGWDSDNNYDLYDVRVGGGFPDPAPTTQECSGETCQGAITVPPGSGGAPASSTFFHGGNKVVHKPQKSVKRCAKGKVRKRVHGKARCVKRHKAKTKRTGRS